MAERGGDGGGGEEREWQKYAASASLIEGFLNGPGSETRKQVTVEFCRTS